MAKKLYMTFGVNAGKSEKTIAISDPVEGLSKSVVEAAAKVMIDTKALNVLGNKVDEFKGAEYKETVVEAIEA